MFERRDSNWSGSEPDSDWVVSESGCVSSVDSTSVARTVKSLGACGFPAGIKRRDGNGFVIRRGVIAIFLELRVSLSLTLLLCFFG